ncbi:hypothetical protein DdX_12874 [Ditylenchus destructor]|uniref:Uncharacterized protein n=1 Tax=Ditylenchus destructor TaxID=166010 RepID=A0AAD4R392_9BILA|nr:hypothetical protein DdX_12874 [Ditylenchus destructor]
MLPHFYTKLIVGTLNLVFGLQFFVALSRKGHKNIVSGISHTYYKYERSSAASRRNFTRKREACICGASRTAISGQGWVVLKPCAFLRRFTAQQPNNDFDGENTP